MASTAVAPEERLDDWARKLSETFQRSATIRRNEAELREDVHQLVLNAAADLYGLTDLDTTGERSAASGARRYDRAYGGLVVEWEWNMDASRRRKGAEQALGYLDDMRSSAGVDAAFSAVVCDGKQFGFLVDDPPRHQLELDEPPPPEADGRFEWRPNSEAACRRFLALIGTNQQRAVSAHELAAQFGPGSMATRDAITLLGEALAGRTVEDRADTLFREWERSLEVVYEDLSDPHGKLAEVLREAYTLAARRPLGELLFSVHTYFALIARLVAIEVLAISANDREAQPSLWSTLPDEELERRLRAIDAGNVPAGLDVQNLFEGDVFSWYLDALPGNSDLLNALRAVLDGIGRFAFPRLAFGANPATDILRDLYQQLLPRELRKALGEFLTPQWLAEACLERLAAVGAPLASGRVLDPTCGTATFLTPVLTRRVSALRAGGSQASTAQVQAVLDSVVGFDLNPVAVVAARANLTIPIWRCDSVLFPDTAAVQTQMGPGRLHGREWLALTTSLAEPFPVHPKLADAEHMSRLRRLLELAVEDPDRDQALEDFRAGMLDEFGPGAAQPVAAGDDWVDVLEVSTELYERIRALREEDRNGVWARIIENSFAPLFAGRFDVVVGNPPWLGWGKMPASWRAGGMRHWKRYGLWRPPPEDGKLASRPQMGDVATLVYATSLDRYAKAGGHVGLLVPKNLIIGDPGGRAFRRFRLRADAEDVKDVGYGPDLPFRALYCDLWDALNPFSPDASNKPIFLVSRTGQEHTYPVPTSLWRRATQSKLEARWVRTRALLREQPGECMPVTRSVETSQWSFVPKGETVIEGGEQSLDLRGWPSHAGCER
ncbi:MAG: N-6 DNA methylase, partial [Actinobacteria bacterium]|nr:N-6 DNA methylase [Actinomycetota bacterium]